MNKDIKTSIKVLREEYGCQVDSLHLDARNLLNIGYGLDQAFDFIPTFLPMVPVPIVLDGVKIIFGDTGELFDPFIKFTAEDPEGFGTKEFRLELCRSDIEVDREPTTFTM